MLWQQLLGLHIPTATSSPVVHSPTPLPRAWLYGMLTMQDLLPQGHPAHPWPVRDPKPHLDTGSITPKPGHQSGCTDRTQRMLGSPIPAPCAVLMVPFGPTGRAR